MTNNKNEKAKTFDKESGFESVTEMMDVLSINLVLSVLDELSGQYVNSPNGWRDIDFTADALRRMAGTPTARLRENKRNLVEVLKQTYMRMNEYNFA